MKQEDIWQYDNLTIDEVSVMVNRKDLPCALCGRPADEGRSINGRGTGKGKWSIYAYETYCKECLQAAYKKAEELHENNWTYRGINPYFYRWEIAHRRAVIVAKLDREVAKAQADEETAE